jgi:hypothetical protein
MRDTELGFRLCLLYPRRPSETGRGLAFAGAKPVAGNHDPDQHPRTRANWNLSQPCNEMTTLPIRASFSM